MSYCPDSQRSYVVLAQSCLTRTVTEARGPIVGKLNAEQACGELRAATRLLGGHDTKVVLVELVPVTHADKVAFAERVTHQLAQ